jgi:drug/metabolite transporter (DMT)-like permease
MASIDLTKKSWQWTTLLFLSFVWGSSFILMKKGLQSYNNVQVAAFRVLFAYLLLLPFSIKSLKKVNKQNIKSLLIVGFIGTAIPAWLFTTAQVHISSALAGMLNSLTPFFTLLIGLTIYRTKTKWLNIIGVFVGFVGALGLMGIQITNIFREFDKYALPIVIATLCYGINVNEVKTKLHHMTSFEITSLAFFFIGPVSIVFLLFSDFSGVAETDGYILNLVYIFLLSLFSSVICLLIFNMLIKYTTSVFAASVTYIIPIFAIMWGVLDKEVISIQQMFSISIILFGVYLVNKN